MFDQLRLRYSALSLGRVYGMGMFKLESVIGSRRGSGCASASATTNTAVDSQSRAMNVVWLLVDQSPFGLGTCEESAE